MYIIAKFIQHNQQDFPFLYVFVIYTLIYGVYYIFPTDMDTHTYVQWWKIEKCATKISELGLLDAISLRNTHG